MSAIPLEDTFADVLSKARRGLGLEIDALAGEAGLPASKVEAVLGGEVDEEAIRALAGPLELHPGRLVALAKGDYHPVEISPLKGFACFNTAFEDMTVNAYLAWDAEGNAVAFDTGADCDPILAALKEYGLTLRLILLTHSHGDHIYDLDRLKEKTGAQAWIGEKEPIDGAETFAPGEEFQVGSLKIETRSTWGHAVGGITYVVRGLGVDLAIVGDAIFAGSMGGGMVSYRDALRTNRESIFTLSDHTVICPGHGPLTTVGEQKQANPFFPEF